jgi:hypothetical protein
MERALELSREGRHRDALLLLNLVEVRIPRKSEPVVPAGEEEPPSESSSAPLPAPAKPRKRQP